MSVRNSIFEMKDVVSEWRRQIHSHPELCFEEVKTSALVQEKLAEFGVEFHTGYAKTGVVGVLKNGTSERSIGFRADMDALPLTEENDVPYKSKIDGKMHACGHDGHTACLLGAAKYLAETKNFDGTVYFYFQPAEEGGGGANVMIQEGLFDNFKPDEVYALHTRAGLPVGDIAMDSGAASAAPDDFRITIQGLGGHAARPQMALDPLYAITQIYTAMQSLVARRASPFDNLVVSITQIHGGTANNIIPDTAWLGGTVRSVDPNTRDQMEQEITQMATHIATGLGMTADVEYIRRYPPMYNDETATENARNAAIAAVGEDHVSISEKSMGGEDFAYMQQIVPGCMVLLGNGDTAGVHHPRFNFDDEAIPYAIEWYTQLAEGRLAAKS